MVRPEWGLEEILVRVRPDPDAATIQAIGEAWDRAAPGVPFTYQYLSQRRDEYGSFDVILWWLAGFMAFISVLGVFGLVSFATVRRTREVGVRKALGATAASVVWLFGAQFTRLVLLAVVLAWPLAWWMSEQFLGGAANRIGLDWVGYVGAGAVALALTWAVGVVHMWRAAKLNPAHCLRVE